MKRLLQLTVNGEEHEVAVAAHATLLTVLRDELGFVGPKRGCDSGGCGCCTVHVDGRAVYSCMMFALSAGGKSVTTIEGLMTTERRLDPLQEAFVQAGAVQCGYCTCGMIMAAKQLLAEEPHPDDEQIRHGIAGNLCRCTGYHKIVEAIRLAASAS
jgi:carbon-monoxide dehydrogenase small subunit